jgi:hypothetical protein
MKRVTLILMRKDETICGDHLSLASMSHSDRGKAHGAWSSIPPKRNCSI